jgi:hypothetical protein
LKDKAMKYRIEVQHKSGDWGQCGGDSPENDVFNTEELADAAIEGLRALGGDFADATFRVTHAETGVLVSTWRAPSTEYAFAFECENREACQNEGTLADALEIAKNNRVTVRLEDEAGFPRGWVYANGNFKLI